MKTLLPARFFKRPTLRVGRELLGKFLVRKVGHKMISGMITEVEAYVGPEDRASHASRGKTPRTEVMFGKPGHWYVYLIYGMHCCLNIVTEKQGYPAAVLIRSVCTNPANRQLSLGICGKCIRGPGRICKKFNITREINKKPAKKSSGLWIEDRGVKINPHTNRAQRNKKGTGHSARYGVGVNPRRIKRGKRIGVDYAGKWKDKKWRFYL